MSAQDEPAKDAPIRPAGQRARLVPPRLGEVERRTRSGREALGWARNLHGDKRRWLLTGAGNLALLALLIGAPLVRGRYRAHASERAYQALAGCLYGSQVTGGLGDFPAEAELLAGQLVRAEPGLPTRCAQLVDAVPPPSALFVLPFVKEAEQRVRDAARLLRNELPTLSRQTRGAPVPERAARALKLLRTTVRAQLEEAGISAREARLPMHVVTGHALPRPARLPLYAARDAALTLQGDDHALRVFAFDLTGVSYLQLEPGRPFTRARLTRPRPVRALASLGAHNWLVAATPEARCRERAHGCFGKTTQIARVSSPLLSLPDMRSLAAHLVGRPDRSLAYVHERLLMASANESGRVVVRELALPEGFAVGADLPPVNAERSFSTAVDEALLLSSPDGALVLGTERDSESVRLVRLDARSATVLTSLQTGQPTWLTGCADPRRSAFAFGDASQLQIGELTNVAAGSAPQLWQLVPWAAGTERVIDPEAAVRDRVVTLCVPRGVLVLARDASDNLSAFSCRHGEPRCRRSELATGVRQFSALPTQRGVLVAYAGESSPQVRVRELDLSTGALAAEVVPAACWSSGLGMCARPLLARLGSRIVLVAPENSDLSALESADDGKSWRPVPVL